MKAEYALSVLAVLACMSFTVQAQDFYLDANGITVRCENAQVGDTGTVFGMEYLAVDNNTIVSEHDSGRDMGTVCTSHVTVMDQLFEGKDVRGDIRTWDTGSVTTMYRMFKSSSNFNQDIDRWNVSSVTNMSSMFHWATSFNQNLNNWDVSSVTNMNEMFKQAQVFDSDITGWDVSSVVSSVAMFDYAFAFNQDISGWDVSSVVDANGMFAGARAFNQDIGGWDVSSVTDMTWMFAEAQVFNQDISGWDVSNVTSMRQMFQSASAFDQDISGWDVGSVTTMERMFEDASTFDKSIGSWNVESVQNMAFMFHRALRFDQDLSSWCVPLIPDIPQDFATSSPLEGQTALHPNWDCNRVPVSDARASTTSGPAPLDVTFTAAFSSDPDGDPLTYMWDFGDGTVSNQTVVTHTFPTGTYTVSLTVLDGELSDISTLSINALNVAPTVAVTTSDLEGPYPLEVTFDASNSTDANGDALTYNWDFGDGSTSTDAAPSHTFAEGTWTVTLGVSDGTTTETTTLTVASLSAAPVAVASSSAFEGLAPLEVSFDATASTDANGETLSYLWAFGDGETSTEPTTTHTYPAGEYTVTLLVSDGSSSDTETLQVVSINEAPTPTLELSSTLGQAPHEVTFTAENSTDANGDALTFAWDLGDGTTSTDTTLVHTYTAAGDYSVVLTVSDGITSASDSVKVFIASGVDTESLELPTTFVLQAAYPNPFNPTTTVTYGLPAASEVHITATDLLGRQIATLVAGDMKAAGYHTVQFNAEGLASGTYLIRMEAGEFVDTKQVVLLK